MEAVIILVLLFVGGGIGLIVWDMNRISRRTLDLKRTVQGHIDTFNSACKNNNLSISQIDFTIASNSEWNSWIQKVTTIVRNVLKTKENDFTSKHNVTSQFYISKSAGLGTCCVSPTHFFYRIGFCPENVRDYVAPGVHIVEDKMFLPKVKFEDNKEILGYNVVVGNNTIKAEQYFNVLTSFINSYKNTSYNSILLDDIIHFRVEGQVEHVSNVSGTGGGVNLEGAVKGGVMFGVAGAIVGSQIGTETNIHTQIIKKDNRRVVLSYTQNGVLKTDTFSSQDPETMIYVMRQLIPQKEQSVSAVSHSVQQKNTNQLLEKKTESQQSHLVQIKELKELLDIGAITQEEFDAKKKQLLGL